MKMNTVEELHEYIESKTDEEVIVFKDYDYASAFIGLSYDNRAVYDYNKMIESLIGCSLEDYDESEKEILTEGKMSLEDAIEWIDYNTLRALPYYENAPIILFGLEEF